MKHEGLEDELSRYLGLVSHRPSPEQVSLLVRHVLLVEDANRRLNLTRFESPQTALRRHTADSLTVLDDVNSAPPGVILDLGAGAGFPGIPLAICTDREFDLLDSVAKKMREVEAVVADLGLDSRVHVIPERAELVARERRGRYAAVVARAVSELPSLVELAAPLLKQSGVLICLKGQPSGDEVRRGDAVARLVGFSPAELRAFDLPEEVGHRTILKYTLAGASKVNLPRREGLAQHSPLA